MGSDRAGCGMKRGRSTGNPTKAEASRIVAVKEGPCVACLIFTGQSYLGCDAHHLLSGGRRIGHMATVGLCAYHHRRVMPEGETGVSMFEQFGPSLMDGSKLFREAYGTDVELLALQNQILGES